MATEELSVHTTLGNVFVQCTGQWKQVTFLHVEVHMQRSLFFEHDAEFLSRCRIGDAACDHTLAQQLELDIWESGTHFLQRPGPFVASELHENPIFSPFDRHHGSWLGFHIIVPFSSVARSACYSWHLPNNITIVDARDRSVELNPICIEQLQHSDGILEAKLVSLDADPSSFLETESQVYSKARSAMMLLTAPLTPITGLITDSTAKFVKADILNSFVSEAVSGLIRELGDTTGPLLSDAIGPVVAQQLKETLPPIIVNTLIQSVTRDVGSSLAARLNHEIYPEIARLIEAHLLYHLPDELNENYADDLVNMLELTLSHSLSRSLISAISQTVNPLLKSDVYNLHNDASIKLEACQMCHEHRRDCKQCPTSDASISESMYNAERYASASADYQATYLADAMLKRSKQQ